MKKYNILKVHFYKHEISKEEDIQNPYLFTYVNFLRMKTLYFFSEFYLYFDYFI